MDDTAKVDFTGIPNWQGEGEGKQPDLPLPLSEVWDAELSWHGLLVTCPLVQGHHTVVEHILCTQKKQLT